MVKGLVTVVLPVFNVEKYLDASIQSVVNQTYKNIEILLIDDGSTDSCPAICDKWALQDDRIKVIHKKNNGLGMARNTGIENATGEFICFFDSDDYVSEQAVEKLYNSAVEENAQAVVFGLSTFNESGKITEEFPPKTGYRIYEGDEVKNSFLPDFIAPDPNGDGTRLFYMSSCLILYSNELIQSSGWRFVSERDIISEDVYSLLGFFVYVNKIVVLPQVFYFYRKNETSLSRSYQENRYKKIKSFYTQSIELCNKCGYGEIILHRLSKPYLAFTISALKQECVVDRPFAETYRIIKDIFKDGCLNQVLNQNKHDKVSTTRKILFFTIRHRLYFLSWLLLNFNARRS